MKIQSFEASKWAYMMIKNGFSQAETSEMLNPLDDYCRCNTIDSFIFELRNTGFCEAISPYLCGYYGVVVAYR